MDLTTITVSYLNDYQFHAEWLHAYYATLETALKGRNINVTHFIALNDNRKKLAKENVLNVVEKYSLPSYTPVFKKVEVDESKDNIVSVHHTSALEQVLQDVSENMIFKNSDLFLIEEFDVLHKLDYFSKLKKLQLHSQNWNSFFGSLVPGSILVSDNQDHDRRSIINLPATGKIESDKGEFYMWQPRIRPHFFGFSRNLYNEFVSFEGRFVNKVSDSAQDFSRKNFDEVNYFCEAGTDFFKELIDRNNFFHLNDPNFFLHLRGLTRHCLDLKENLQRNKSAESQYKQLEERFEKVKNLLNETSSAEKSIFSFESFSEVVKEII